MESTSLEERTGGTSHWSVSLLEKLFLDGVALSTPATYFSLLVGLTPAKLCMIAPLVDGEELRLDYNADRVSSGAIIRICYSPSSNAFEIELADGGLYEVHRSSKPLKAGCMRGAIVALDVYWPVIHDGRGKPFGYAPRLDLAPPSLSLKGSIEVERAVRRNPKHPPI